MLFALVATGSPVAVSAQEPAPTTIQQPNVDHRRLSPDQVRQASPALEQLTQQRLYGEVWRRPGLSPRDRSLVTIAALIAQGQSPALGYYANQAIENGVTPSELSEELLQTAFYAGWGKAMAAVGPMREVFAARGVRATNLPPAFGPLLPLDLSEDDVRANGVRSNFEAVSPSTVDYTNGLLFREVWQRPYLSQRDRSLVTIATLIADGKAEQLAYHLNRGMDQGLTAGQVSEMLTHLAFYAGWPNTFSALPVVKRVLAERAGKAEGSGK
ncbi:carboxymuconolactone decarboxylase family protein [Sphingomonas morindae]|uniref:Carboxymuconolactone decarboxylase family protein n=1 Tax=Sphingomonas morindae TaxID=1541170 RepID=A0ABY4X3R2_9SPHN|nr:carboxymuconolactone decarboxylase family protein [Sphingomonas morindae]USI71526.1 carboxymuconolactone decarboxylase family protein [Sphingomonas morindae]